MIEAVNLIKPLPGKANGLTQWVSFCVILFDTSQWTEIELLNYLLTNGCTRKQLFLTLLWFMKWNDFWSIALCNSRSNRIFLFRVDVSNDIPNRIQDDILLSLLLLFNFQKLMGYFQSNIVWWQLKKLFAMHTFTHTFKSRSAAKFNLGNLIYIKLQDSIYICFYVYLSLCLCLFNDMTQTRMLKESEWGWNFRTWSFMTPQILADMTSTTKCGTRARVILKLYFFAVTPFNGWLLFEFLF